MNIFDQKLQEAGQYPLKADRTDTFVVNFGIGNNTRDLYYYSEALNQRKDIISLETINKILDILKENRDVSLIEITGVSPETNPNFKYFVSSAVDMGKKLAVVTNPAVYTKPGMESMPEFLAQHKVKILAFVPHYVESSVDRYTENGTHNKIISGMKMVNTAGFGQAGSDLTVAFVYLPAEPEPALQRDVLLKCFRKEYTEKHRISFNHFIVFNTIPIGRFDHESYRKALRDDFNPATLKKLPCRHAVSIASDGRLFDCDFLVAAGLPVKSKSPDLDTFDYSLIKNREVATSDLCFGCTAGEGATCAECFT